MTDWGKSGRTDRYYAKLVDPHTMVEFPEEVEIDAPSCSITWAQDSDTFASASVELVNSATEKNVGDSRLNCMLRLYHGLKVDDYDTLDHPSPLGTFFATVSSTSSEYNTVYRKLSCYSAMLRHTEDTLMRDYSFLGAAAGTANNHCISFIKQIVEADGGRLDVDASCHEADQSGRIPIERTFGRDVFFKAGSNKAEVMGTVAGWIGCELGVTPEGHILVKRNVPPNMRPIKYTFESGVNCVYLPGIDWKDTRGSGVNRVRAVNSSQNGAAAGVAELPDSAVGSFAMRGYHVTKTVQSKDANATPVQLAEIAQQALNDLSAGESIIELESVSVPGLENGDVVIYRNEHDWPDGAIDNVCEIIEKSCSLNLGCMTKWKLKVI